MIIALMGLKGGQGRSTIAARLGAWLARAGHSTCVVDLASTGTATLLLGGVMDGPGSGALLAQKGLDRLVKPTSVPLLSHVPADDALLEIARLPAREPSRTALPALGQRFDVVLLDAPPGAGTTALIALTSAAWVLAPVVPDEAGVAGVEATLRLLRGGLPARPKAGLLGLVVNAVESRRAAHVAGEAALRAAHGRDVLRTTIRRDPAVTTASSLTRVMRSGAPRGADADFRALRSEVLRAIVKRS